MRSDHMGRVEKRSVRLIIETKVGPEGGKHYKIRNLKEKIITQLLV